MHDAYDIVGSDHVPDNTAEIPLKAVRSEDVVIGLRWVNVFALLWTDRNTANPAVKTNHRRRTNPYYIWLSNNSNLGQY